MKPGAYNFEIKQGSSLERRFNWTAGGDTVNLTGYTGRLVVRYRADSPNILLDCTVANERIVLAATSPNIIVRVAKTVTQTLAPGQYVYDLELTSASGFDYPLLTGRFAVLPNTVPAA